MIGDVLTPVFLFGELTLEFLVDFIYSFGWNDEPPRHMENCFKPQCSLIECPKNILAEVVKAEIKRKEVHNGNLNRTNTTLRIELEQLEQDLDADDDDDGDTDNESNEYVQVDDDFYDFNMRWKEI